MSCFEDYLSQVTPDGWVSFFGALIGVMSALLSILSEIRISKNQLKQQKKENKKIYYDKLLGSLPSIDMLCTQADYLNNEDGLLGSFVDVEARSKVLEDRMNDQSSNIAEREQYRYKIKCHENYINYWNKANATIEDFYTNGFFNVVKNECSGNVIIAYYDFVVAFQNEHFYCGPIIRTELLRNLLINLAEEIRKAEEDVNFCG